MERRLTERDVPKEQTSLSEIFNKAFPIYLSMGMTSAEFWEQDPALVLAYKEAHRLRFEEQNHLAWLQGRYVYDALCSASPLFHDLAKRGTTAAPYHKEPIKFYRNEEERLEDENEKLRQQTIAYFTQLITEGGQNG